MDPDDTVDGPLAALEETEQHEMLEEELDEWEEDDGDVAALEAGGAEPKPQAEIRNWEDLRVLAKDQLKTSKKDGASLTQINQLIIICNFATL